jgi:hypothetical protein
VPDAGPPDAGAPVEDAGRPQVELALTIHTRLLDGGTGELPLEPGSRPLIDPPIALEVDANLALVNYRIRLVDEADRVIPSDDRGDESDGRTHYGLTPVQPLEPGRRYALLIDAQTGATFADASGRAHPDVRVEFQTAGERARPAKKPKRKRH